jgi:putative PIN family toxin of toxin-antitoxin system
MKAVIDTNVFVSSFFGGPPRHIINQWKTGQVTLCVSRDIIAEYVGVLQRLHLKNQKELAEILELFARGHHLLFAGKTPRLKIVADPADDIFFECAVALQAAYIISGDKHVVAIKNYMEIQALTPREFLNVSKGTPEID